MSGRSAFRFLAHAIAVITIGGVAAQIIVAAIQEPRNLVWGFGVSLLTLTALVAGWLIALRRPRNPLGWLIIAVPLLLGLQGYAVALATILADRAPVATGWLDWYGGDNQWSWLPPVGILFTQIPLRFPDGGLLSPRWRWFSWFTIAAIAVATVVNMTLGPEVGTHVPNPTFVRWGAAEQFVILAGFVPLAVAMVGSLGSIAVRYHRGVEVERAQLRWVFWAVSVVVGLFIGALVLTTLVGGTEQDTVGSGIARVGLLGAHAATSLVPLAILFAVLRRGLYSIDRIISRTAAYAIVTLVAIGTYFGVVLLVSLVLPTDRNHPQPIVIALATLAAAAVFLPALRWVRRLVDRVFNRTQYDAERVVETFGERIRNGADPHTADADLMGAVRRTLQPTAIGLWTRENVR